MAVCLGSARVCALRVSRLDDACACVAGEDNAVVSSAIVRLQASPEYETGDEFIQKNGCGDIVINIKDVDRLKRINITMELATRDIALLELLTGGTVYQDGEGNIIGFARRGVGVAANDPVAMELWTRAVSAAGNCTTEAASWWRWTYPKATLTLGDVSHENGIGLVQLTGFAEANPNYGNGCFDDWPAADEIDPDSPEHFVLDEDGPPTAGCGYISVPAQTS
jgi:hypothetical protein